MKPRSTAIVLNLDFFIKNKQFMNKIEQSLIFIPSINSFLFLLLFLVLLLPELASSQTPPTEPSFNGNILNGCGDNTSVEVIGKGLISTSSNSMSIPNPGNVKKVLAELNWEDDEGGCNSVPATVTFTASNGTSKKVSGIQLTNNNTTSPAEKDTYFRALFEGSISSVSFGAVQGCRPISLVLYVFREAPGNTSSVGCINATVYKGSVSKTISIGTSAVARNITVQVPVAEMDEDGRVAILTATAGGVTATKTINNNTLGDRLNIVTLTLNNVPGSTNTVTLTAKSPNSNGDSFAIGFSANATCTTATARIGNLVYKDNNADGFFNGGDERIEGATVKLLNASGTVLETKTTNSNGNYSFTGLLPGDYKVMFNTPTGCLPSVKTGNASDGVNNDNDNSPSTGMTNLISLSDGEIDNTIDAGFKPNLPCSISAVLSNVACNDNGTPNNPGDDTYTFKITANKSGNCGSTWAGGGKTGSYGSAVTFGPYAISGGNKTITICDAQNTAACATVTATAPATCSTGTVCNNVTNGGTIGFGSACSGSYQHCPTTGNAQNIGNCASPSGGSGSLEIVWLKSTTSCLPPTTTAEQIMAGLDPHWVHIPGATGLNYSPGAVNQATCYLRCSRRAGCDVYVESNIISLSISPNCGGGNTPNCSNIGIAASNGKITVSGLNGAPVTSVQIFNSSWQQMHNCFANCPSPSADFAVSPGSYYVYVKYYTAAYTLVCEVNQTVNVTQNLANASNERLKFEALKHLEHSEIIWLHEGDDNIVEYALERSVDGIHFEELSVQPADLDAAADFYRDFDLEPASGKNFYRLQMRYSDGSSAYSAVRLVEFEDVLNFTIFPNPANQFAHLDLEPLVGKAVDIQIFNSFGIQIESIHLDEVWSKYHQLDLRSFHEGQYLIWVHSEGRRSMPVKLVIGKF
jgi:hypothetical protein